MRYSNLGVAEMQARIADSPARHTPARIVASSPYGALDPWLGHAARQGVYSGLPVVMVGRGDQEGFASMAPAFLRRRP